MTVLPLDDRLTRVTDETVAVRASAALPTLSRAERRVGRALLADYPSAGLASAARLAERAEVSPPTVLRFAQSLGYDRFTDLQVALRAELSARSSGPITRLPDAPPAGQPARSIAAAGARPEQPSRRNIGPAAGIRARGRRGAPGGHQSGGISARRVASRTCWRYTWPPTWSSCARRCGCSRNPAAAISASCWSSHAPTSIVLFDFHRYQRSAAALASRVHRCRRDSVAHHR